MTNFDTVIAINETHGQDVLTASLLAGNMSLTQSLTATITGSLHHIFTTYPTAEYFHIFHDGEWCFLDRSDVYDMI